MDHSLSLARRTATEGLATFALVFAGCGAIITDQRYHGSLGSVGVSLVFGLIIMAMIYATGHLSGAHINPSVTIAFTLTRHFSPNPARSFRPALVAGEWRGFSVDVAGPVLGAATGAFAYQLVRGAKPLPPSLSNPIERA